MHIFKKLIFILSSHERKRAVLLIIMIIIMSLLDMIGVASILPFMTILSNPSLVETNIILKTLFQITSRYGIETNKEFLFFLGILVLVLLIFSLTFKALANYAQIRFIFMREYSIGKRLIEGYLAQPYSWFLSRNSNEIGKNVLSEVTNVIQSGMSPLMELIANSILVVALITLLLVVDPKLTIIVALTLLFFYMLIFLFVGNFLKKIGADRLKNNQLRFTSISEAFGAIKEVKVGGLENVYIKSFSNPAKIYARTIASSQVLARLPRYMLEIIAFGGILLIVLYQMSKTGTFSNSLPIISLYAFAGYRLLPALQIIYNCLSRLTFISPAVDKLYSEIKNLKLQNTSQDQNILTFNKSIVLNDVNYNYPNSDRTALKNINISIPAKSTIGLIGPTGSGKTTLVDIILGLLQPQKGTLKIDGNIINESNLKSWQGSIGYVPQHIYLSDTTIESNIAFGVDPEDISQDNVEEVSKIANLHDFVSTELPEGYQTKVGERGIRLSGGQRQRIGIARALYHKPKVLILDEATSALDNQTEQKVMEKINKLRKDLTIISIAHRLNTIKNCDIVFRFKKGQLVAQGTFDELFDNN